MLEAFRSAKGADADRQAVEELAGSSGGALDAATILRVFLGIQRRMRLHNTVPGPTSGRNYINADFARFVSSRSQFAKGENRTPRASRGARPNPIGLSSDQHGNTKTGTSLSGATHRFSERLRRKAFPLFR
jgi:hypothetical protein